jgi:hypothetical protein
MVGTRSTFKSKSTWLLTLFTAMLLVSAAACGGTSDEPSTAVAANSADQSILDPSGTDDSGDANQGALTPVDPLVVPVVEPEPGSDEAVILNSLSNVALAVATKDWDLFVETCNPNRRMKNGAQAELLVEFYIAQGRADLSGLNYRDVAVQIFDDGSAATTAVEYLRDEVGTEQVQFSWFNSDGIWYLNTNCINTG